jgi:hypothetical protein
MPALPFGLPRANHLAVTVLERAQFAIRGSRKRFFPLAAIIANELPAPLTSPCDLRHGLMVTAGRRFT